MHGGADPVSHQIGAKAQHHTRDERVGVNGEDRRRTRRHQDDQEQEPLRKARSQTPDHPGPVPGPADHAENETGGELRGCGESQRAQSGKAAESSEAWIEHIGEKQQRGDHQPAQHKQSFRNSAAIGRSDQRFSKGQWRDDVIRDHGR